MNDQLVHIFDDSTCLTKRQLKDYVTGIMGDEECHAAEVHLNSCPFCSDAVDGMMMHKDEAAQLLADLNPDFLKEHFAQNMPQVHLNSIAVPVDQHMTGKKKKNNTRPLWRTASVAAAVLFCMGLVWYYGYQKEAFRNDKIAQDLPANKNAVSAEPDKEMIVSTTPETPVASRTQDVAATKTATDEPLTVTAAPEKKEDADKPAAADVAATPEAKKPAAALVAGKLTADSQYTLRTSSQNYGYSNVQSSDARPYYGNALQNNRSLNQSFNTSDNYSLSRQSQSSGTPSLVSSNKLAKPFTLPKPAAKEAEVQSAPAAAQNDMATTSTGAYQSKSATNVNVSGARSEEARYVVNGVETKRKKDLQADISLKKAKWKASDANGDDLYDKGDYKAALAAYNRDMSSDNKGRRHYATLGAARCYLNMGQKTKAKQLLQGLIDEGGAQSRAAKKMLRKIDGDAQ